MTTVAMRAPVVVMASGVFDILHRGHLNLLWRAKRLGEILVVGVVTDEGTKAYKGRLPAQDEITRRAAIRRLSFVDACELQSGTDPTNLLERFRPDVLVHGDDWVTLKAGHETVERLGIQWVRVPYTPDVSTTLLRERAG